MSNIYSTGDFADTKDFDGKSFEVLHMEESREGVFQNEDEHVVEAEALPPRRRDRRLLLKLRIGGYVLTAIGLLIGAVALNHARSRFLNGGMNAPSLNWIVVETMMSGLLSSTGFVLMVCSSDPFSEPEQISEHVDRESTSCEPGSATRRESFIS